MTMTRWTVNIPCTEKEKDEMKRVAKAAGVKHSTYLLELHQLFSVRYLETHGERLELQNKHRKALIEELRGMVTKSPNTLHHERRMR